MTSNIIEELNIGEITKLLTSRSESYNPITEATFTELLHCKATLNTLFSVDLNASKFVARLKIIKKDGVDSRDILRCPFHFLTDSFRDNGASIDDIVNDLFSKKYQGEQKTLRLLIAYSLFVQSCYALEIFNEDDRAIFNAIKAGCLFRNTNGFEWLYVFHLVRMTEIDKKFINPHNIGENIIKYFDIENRLHLSAIHETLKVMQKNLPVFTEFIFEKAKDSNEFQEIMKYFSQDIFNEKSDVYELLLENSMFTDLYDLIE